MSTDQADRRAGGPFGRVRQAFARNFSRLAPTDDEIEAEELRGHCRDDGATLVEALPDRERVTVSGILRTVTLRPRAGVPALVAELYDGSGTITLIWLGRRQIPGIEPGRELVAKGLAVLDDGRASMFNPRYELHATSGPAQ